VGFDEQEKQILTKIISSKPVIVEYFTVFNIPGRKI
jgi:hypothetical protein